MGNVILSISLVLSLAPLAHAMDWNAQGRQGAAQDRVVLAHDGQPS